MTSPQSATPYDSSRKTDYQELPARIGHLNMRAQAKLPSARRPDTPTQLALVDVTGARRLARSFPEAVALGRLRRRIELSN
jgi:hypothetical protein